MRAEADAQTLGKRAYSELRERILGGQLQPGQRLSLRGMASDLGMSMVPIGEALRELARDGLIENEPRWGARVRKLDLETLRNQHVLRMAIECEAVRQCVERALPAQLDEAMAIAVELDRLVARNGEAERVFELDARFHLRLAQASGFPALADSLRANQLMRLLARGSRIAHGREDRPLRAHQELVEAIRSGDAGVAESAMRSHCQASMALQLDWFARGELEAPAEPAPKRRAR